MLRQPHWQCSRKNNKNMLNQWRRSSASFSWTTKPLQTPLCLCPGRIQSKLRKERLLSQSSFVQAEASGDGFAASRDVKEEPAGEAAEQPQGTVDTFFERWGIDVFGDNVMVFDVDTTEPIPIDGVSATSGPDTLLIRGEIVAGQRRMGALKKLIPPIASVELPSVGESPHRQVSVNVDNIRAVHEASKTKPKKCPGPHPCLSQIGEPLTMYDFDVFDD